ncbi:hypothetical protein BSKO_11112 [Bryopsis sp. KO-2023]|nr:hypothetical protein BSKO_11112 [Bryopsis sp. KO-2023]
MVKRYCIALDNYDVSPGGAVTGQVLLETNERTKARAVRISLVGKEKVHITRSNGQSQTSYYAKRKLVDEQVTLLGLPKGSDGDPIFLEKGRQYSLPLRFSLPRDCLPSCGHNAGNRIFYEIKSWVDRPMKLDLKCRAELRMLPDVHVASVPQNYFAEVDRRLVPRFCFCCCGKGFVQIKIKLPKASFWWREPIPVEVLVDNSECRSPIKYFKVELVIVSTYAARGHVDTHRHQLAGKVFHLSNGQILAHAHEVKFRHTFDESQYQYNWQLPTATVHGAHITHQFIMKATAGYSLGRSSVKLPIFFADGPSNPRGFNQPSAAPPKVDAEAPPRASAAPTSDSGRHPTYNSQESDSEQMYQQMPSDSWAADDAPMYERTVYRK